MRYLATLLTGAGLALVLAAGLGAWPALATDRKVRLLCEAVYLPARTVWNRSVELEHDDQTLRTVRIDGVPVYSFAVDGTRILTSMDNERIQVDLERQTWQSDFRGMAHAQGRCERTR
ncbi:MAG: hypothetical protein R3E94_13040 [Burkholderiaceae bacterium]